MDAPRWMWESVQVMKCLQISEQQHWDVVRVTVCFTACLSLNATLKTIVDNLLMQHRQFFFFFATLQLRSVRSFIVSVSARFSPDSEPLTSTPAASLVSPWWRDGATTASHFISSWSFLAAGLNLLGPSSLNTHTAATCWIFPSRTRVCWYAGSRLFLGVWFFFFSFFFFCCRVNSWRRAITRRWELIWAFGIYVNHMQWETHGGLALKRKWAVSWKKKK